MALLALAVNDARGQQAGDFPIDAAYRARIVDGVAAKFGAGYFNAERASLVRAQLGSPAVRAAYDTARTAASLSAMLTTDLQKWSADRHPRVVFSVRPRPMPQAGKQSPALQNAENESARSRNFGFHALERLTGNPTFGSFASRWQRYLENPVNRARAFAEKADSGAQKPDKTEGRTGGGTGR